jgi:DNA primase
MSQFVDFKALRKSLSFERVLEHYGVTVKRQKGSRHVGFCPLPSHQGKRRSPSFSAKLDVGVWQCFGCKASGNVLDFGVYMSGLDPKNRQHLRQVALELQEKFGAPAVARPPSALALKAVAKAPAAPPAKNLPVVINPPLDFQLQNLDPDHPYLKSRGFLPETIKHFGLGYCNRGLMKGRVVIPLHNVDDNLVGYAGRLADDLEVSEYNPKYRFPSSRERDRKLLEFRSSHLVYNANRLTWPMEDLIVVEGFPSVWWLTQHRYSDVVALMGNSCSDEQARIIVSGLVPDGRVWIMSDGDSGGEHCAESIFSQIAPYRCVRWVKLSRGQPTDYTPGDLEQLFSIK